VRSISSQGYITAVPDLSKPPLKPIYSSLSAARFKPSLRVAPVGFNVRLASGTLPGTALIGAELIRQKPDKSCLCEKLIHVSGLVYYVAAVGWDGRSESGLFLFEGALKFKCAVYLICLLLFVAAVDTIPDPPAINPPSSHSSGISGIHFRGPTTLLEKEWFVSSSSPRCLEVSWFSFRVAFENKTFGVCPAPLVHHAADPSPPENS
jgi:hypothetical protein